MFKKTLEVRSEELLMVLQWENGELNVLFINEDTPTVLKEFVDTGIEEWIEDGFYSAIFRYTPTSSEAFIHNFSEYIRKLFDFSVSITEQRT